LELSKIDQRQVKDGSMVRRNHIEKLAAEANTRDGGSIESPLETIPAF
jgi:hypothetical protein